MADKTAKDKKPAKAKAAAAPSAQQERGKRAKQREGIVVSDKMDKTVVVAATRLVRHPMYGKYVRKTEKYYVHDEKEECSVGDQIRIVETPPISRLKRWKLGEIISKAE